MLLLLLLLSLEIVGRQLMVVLATIPLPICCLKWAREEAEANIVPQFISYVLVGCCSRARWLECGVE